MLADHRDYVAMRLGNVQLNCFAGVPVGEVALQTGFAKSKIFPVLFSKSILASHQVNIPSLRTDD